MKNNKKTFAALTITAAVGLSALLPFNAMAASPFKDTSKAPLVQTAIEQLAQQKVVSGYQDNEFKPNQPITRAELAKMVALALHVSLNASASNGFSDVTSADWFQSYANALAAVGAMKGESGKFHPNQTVSSDQLLDTISNVLKVDKTAVQKLPSSASLSNGHLTRGEAALLIFEAQQLAPIQVTSIRVLNGITLQVTFSAPIPNADLELEAASKNFVFDNGLTISNVPRLKTGSKATYIIPTPTQKAGTTYTLTYKGQPAGTFTGSAEKIALKSTQQVANDMFEIESTLADGVADYGYVIAAYSKGRPGSFIVDENNTYNGKTYQILSSMRMRQVQITPEGGAPMTATYSPFTQATDGRQAPKFILPNGETFHAGVTYKVSADWATFANATFTAKEIAPLAIQSAAAIDEKSFTITMAQDPKDDLFVLRRLTLTAPDGTALTAEYTQSSRKGTAATFAILNKGQLTPGTTYTVAPVGNWATAVGVTLTK
ncbi:S-layer homology domain-containing protein [Paenibacillus sp. SYP-B3998]|uniref:S-layer homology domain-containing protein n=1 Tax=Paenibacillus sp. SYP-B3998 TaxID=2678564 RepID=A0A6G4A5R2_9BACL|nr:S-layer homology domain-containing protein [Paenibacillus sp. SYP-B3998]NEW09284.1 S-layer homology domain-containing protein [Paenibacillus sp. SYP-B3998]